MAAPNRAGAGGTYPQPTCANGDFPGRGGGVGKNTICPMRRPAGPEKSYPYSRFEHKVPDALFGEVPCAEQTTDPLLTLPYRA
jgi:hypothetical protein